MNKINCSEENGSSVFQLIKKGESSLRENEVINPFNEAILIMGHILGKPFDKVITSYADNLSVKKAGLFEKLIERRCRKEPFAYITGRKEFYSIDFFVNKSVLIPRPDTECVVEETIKESKYIHETLKRPVRILDIGTGSGAIAVSVAKNFANSLIFAADNSYRSLAVAIKNIFYNGVRERVIPVYFDIFKNNVSWFDDKNRLYGNSILSFDIIVSNPPYIKSGDLNDLEDGVRLYEPRRALDGGGSGLKFYEKIIDSALACFSCDSDKNNESMEACFKTIIFEIDYRYKSEIGHLVGKKFNALNGNGPKLIELKFINDLNGNERAVRIRYG